MITFLSIRRKSTLVIIKINVLLEISNILIGSSNVYRHYKVNLVSGAKQCLMVKCKQSEVFNATMASLGEKDKFVLISVIKNFISDAVGSKSEQPEPLFEYCRKLLFSCQNRSLVLHCPRIDRLCCGTRREGPRSLK